MNEKQWPGSLNSNGSNNKRNVSYLIGPAGCQRVQTRQQNVTAADNQTLPAPANQLTGGIPCGCCRHRRFSLRHLPFFQKKMHATTRKEKKKSKRFRFKKKKRFKRKKKARPQHETFSRMAETRRSKEIKNAFLKLWLRRAIVSQLLDLMPPPPPQVKGNEREERERKKKKEEERNTPRIYQKRRRRGW